MKEEITLGTKQLAEISLYLFEQYRKEFAEISLYTFEQYRKEFYTPGKHHVAVPQFHHWLQQLINEERIESDD